MSQRFQAEAHIPRGSGDAEWRIIDTRDGTVLAVVDPAMVIEAPDEWAEVIAKALNRLNDTGEGE